MCNVLTFPLRTSGEICRLDFDNTHPRVLAYDVCTLRRFTILGSWLLIVTTECGISNAMQEGYLKQRANHMASSVWCPAKQFDRLGETNPRLPWLPGCLRALRLVKCAVAWVFRTRGLDYQAMINGTECTHGRRFHNGACPLQLQISFFESSLIVDRS